MHIKPTVLAITLSFFLASIVFSNTAQAAVGRTAGSGDVSSAGEANYVVPIHVPDGINGLQPEFALAYGHRKSEGISAVGWGVSGLSVINRCAKTFAQDGDTKNVELTTSDRFCVDGVQLRLTSGTYGSAGSQYRSEIDTISKYIAGGTAGNGPAYFTVKHKNGLTYEYGNTADSRIESLASGFTTTALTWALNKISDRNGNEILFVYEDDGVPYGDYRIDYVTYRSNPGQGVAPGYKVDFKYLVQPIEDVDINYAAGGIIEDTKRLYQIDVLYTVALPDTVVRKYKLNYEANLSSANRSRLSSVEECAGYPLECLSATTFTYQDGTVALDSSEVATGTTITAGARMMPMDVNGDGRDDLVYASSSGKWAYQLSNGSGYDSAYITTINSTNSADAIITDHNSDGIDDILVPYSGGTWWAIHGSNTGVHLQTPVNTSAPDTTAAGDATSLDINGDGRDDLIWAEHYSSGGPSIRGRTRLSTGNGYSSSYATVYQASSNTTFLGSSVFAGSYEQNKRKNFDVNGDGIHDVAIVTERTGGTRLEPWELQFTDVILGGGAGQYSVKSDTSNGLPIDINGDGYTDIAYRVYNGSLLYRLSNGKSFGVETTGPSLANLNFNLAVAMDFNGDGMQDLLVPNTSTNTWFYLESEGDSFATAVDTTRSSAGVVDTYSVDHDGDGLADVGLKKTSGSNYTYAHRRHSGVKPDLMASAIDGYGNSIAYSYTSIAQSSYTKGTGAVFPNQDYIGPLQVVTVADISTGIGSNTYTETYTYSGALFNVQGRALSPFETVTIVDNRNNLKLTETYLREFPYRGRMSGRDFLQQNGTPIQVVTNTWSAKTGGSGNQNYHHPYISATLEKNYEVAGAFNGAQIDEVSSTMVVDTYGTRTSTTTTRTEKSTANGLNAGATYTEQVVHTGIIDQTLGWCLGKPTQTQWINSHTQSGGYGTQITRTKSRTWDTSGGNCRLTHDITEPYSSSYKVTKFLEYDAFGNIRSRTTTGVGMPSRAVSVNWGTTGQFPTQTVNALLQATTATWDPALGTKLTETDANGNTSSFDYDFFGRRTRSTNADGTYVDYTLTACSSTNAYCGTSHNLVVTEVKASTKKTTGAEIRADFTYIDKSGRTIQSENQSMLGSMSMVRINYDALGRISQRSAPSFSATPSFYATATYDSLDRLTQIARPIDATDPTLQTTTISYEGLTTTRTDAEGKNAIEVRDVAGRTIRSQDHDGYYQQFDFDAFGSLRRTFDGTNVLMASTYTYGKDAFRLSSTDMDIGAWTYTPNALGEVVAYTDAEAQSFTATFDKLSRPLTRVEPGNTTTWVWGASAAANNIGRLSSISTGAHSESYSYDSLGRTSQRTTVADSTYLTNYSYDSQSGLLDTITYPQSTSSYRLKLDYDYSYGILSSVSDFNAPSTVFWAANSVDARGNIVQETLGNGLQSLRNYDAVTGLIDYVQSGPGGGTARQDMEFQWTKVSRLKQRKDVNRSLTEDFYYDNLHRLDYSNLNSTQNLDLSYDVMGNVLTKSDVGGGAYTYHATKKHAVASAGGLSFTYDGNGNQTKRGTDDITWTSYNYPSRIENGTAKSHDYFYAGDRSKWKQIYTNGSAVETTIFVGGILEKRIEGSYTEYRHYIHIAGKTVALYTRPSSGANVTRYFLHDHLGSTAEITTSAGATEISESFTAFGERRDPVDWSGPISSGDETLIGDTSQRGFTFHSNLESSTLIHMNGRVMDGLTGRFISPDPYVADATLTQSFNRYAYVNNSPLSFTDPSGFTPWQFEFEGIDISLSFRFGKSKRGRAARVVKGCFVLLADSCYGKANSGIFDVSSDVFGDGYGGYGNYNDFILNTYTAGEVAHEGAIIFWPGYDLGTCIYEGGCSWLDWGFGIIGVIPGGKAATTGAKGLVKGAGKLDDLADLRRVSKTCCFVAGTLVDTEDGLVPIEEIKVGDRVWARDVDSGETALKEVTDLIRRHERRIWIVRLESDDGTIQQFETTDDHPWWIPELGWVKTKNLRKGLIAGDRGGESPTVAEAVETERLEATYNLTVAEFETYFVGEIGVLVHNCNIDNVSDIPTNSDELVDLTSAQRREHILDGDATGGGHRSGTDAGKSEFPEDWTDDQVMHAISDVATDPNAITKPGRGTRTVTEGTRNGVDIKVIQESTGEIVSAWPTNTPGT